MFPECSVNIPLHPDLIEITCRNLELPYRQFRMVAVHSAKLKVIPDTRRSIRGTSVSRPLRLAW